MNNIAVNETTVSSRGSAGMKRRQLQDDSLMGFGALSFADILLMLFPTKSLNTQPDAQQDSQQPGESSVQFVPAACTNVIPGIFGDIDDNLAEGVGINRIIQSANEFDGLIETGAEISRPVQPVNDFGKLIEIETETDVSRLVKTGTEAAIPFLRQISELSPEVEAAVQSVVAQRAQTSGLQVPGATQVQQTEAALSGIGQRISAEKPYDTLTRITVPVNEVKTEQSAQAEYEPERQTEFSTPIPISGKPDAQVRPASDGEPWEALYRSVGEAKLRLSREPPSDTDEVMQSINAAEGAGQSLKETVPAAEKAEAIQRSYELPEQISSGISERLREGKSEFVIKLRPEKLGEITVKLVEESGKMTLQIEAVRPETAKLINNDLTALKEAVRPMQVEVREALTPTPDASQLGFHQFSMGGQQQFSNNQGLYYGQTSSSYEFNNDAGESEAQVSLSSQGLDRYV